MSNCGSHNGKAMPSGTVKQAMFKPFTNEQLTDIAGHVYAASEPEPDQHIEALEELDRWEAGEDRNH